MGLFTQIQKQQMLEYSHARIGSLNETMLHNKPKTAQGGRRNIRDLRNVYQTIEVSGNNLDVTISPGPEKSQPETTSIVSQKREVENEEL